MQKVTSLVISIKKTEKDKPMSTLKKIQNGQKASFHWIPIKESSFNRNRAA